jgi:hypothetical protein
MSRTGRHQRPTGGSRTNGRAPPLRQTLTVAYDDVAGRDESEAELFALAIFATESQPGSLPRPETVVAHTE